GRKEDHIASFRGRMRAFDRIREGAGDFTSRRFAPIVGDAVRHLTKKNRGMRFFLHQVAQRLEIETLVFSARDQNHWFGLRLQRFFRRIQIRSEEHTSELQSLAYLVCRLLLEKK